MWSSHKLGGHDLISWHSTSNTSSDFCTYPVVKCACWSFLFSAAVVQPTLTGLVSPFSWLLTRAHTSCCSNSDFTHLPFCTTFPSRSLCSWLHVVVASTQAEAHSQHQGQHCSLQMPLTMKSTAWRFDLSGWRIRILQQWGSGFLRRISVCLVIQSWILQCGWCIVIKELVGWHAELLGRIKWKVCNLEETRLLVRLPSSSTTLAK